MATQEQEAEPDGQFQYSELSIRHTPGFVPMIVVGVVTIVSGVLLIGLPMYWQAGDGELTLMVYTGVLWALMIVALGFLHEYWLGRRENRGEQ
jgi:hypothetical protein